MKLSNVYLAGSKSAIDINISGSLIVDATGTNTNESSIIFNDAVAFPGLINSHDHLDFNLFPQLGDKIYHNYTEWGNYIHQKYPEEIAQVLKVPHDMRVQWGLYKNLLCGVTTVVNHGEKLQMNNAPITVMDTCRSLHSVRFEKHWKRRLNDPLQNNDPIVIHTGEGVDMAANDEIDQLLRWNLLHRKLIAIHGVAMTPKQAKRFKALVWCPWSNYFLLGTTAPIHRLKENLPVLFGTDSTLTGNWNIWKHIHAARKTGYLTDSELFESLTSKAASIWNLNSGELTPGRDADIVIARSKQLNGEVDNLLSLDPADILLVVIKGNIRLFDEILYSQLDHLTKTDFSKVKMDQSYKYVYGDLPKLMANIKRHYNDAQFPITCSCHAQ